MITELLILILTLLVIYHLNYYWQRKNRLTSFGVPIADDHSFFLGHGIEILKTDLTIFVEKYTKKLGDVWTFAFGSYNFIILSNPDAIKKVYIERSTEFNARPNHPNGTHEGEQSLFHSFGKRWKDQRKLLGPAFTAKKMRKLNNDMIHSIFGCIDAIENKTKDGMEIDIFKFFKCMTLEVIETCGFGLKVDYQKSNDKNLFKQLDNFFGNYHFLQLILHFTTLAFYFFNDIVSTLKLSWIMTAFTARDILKKRIGEMYRATLKMDLEQSDQKNLLTIILSTQTDNKQLLTEKAVVENLFLFFVAGYETTSTALSYAVHCLASNPNVQKKLRNELLLFIEEHNETMGDKEEDEKFQFNFDNINEVEYLEAFTKEVLRFRPVAPWVLSRRPLKETEIDVGNGEMVKVFKDTLVMANIPNLHFNSDLWPTEDPLKFVPERHLQDIKRHPMAYVPFGIGPRECIGKRFALMELKLTLAYLVSKFELTPGKKFEFDLKIKQGITNVPKNGVYVNVRRIVE